MVFTVDAFRAPFPNDFNDDLHISAHLKLARKSFFRHSQSTRIGDAGCRCLKPVSLIKPSLAALSEKKIGNVFDANGVLSARSSRCFITATSSARKPSLFNLTEIDTRALETKGRGNPPLPEGHALLVLVMTITLVSTG